MNESLRICVVLLQPTRFCNIDCAYCYLPNRSKKDQVSIKTLQALIDNLLSSKMAKGRILVNWHAGEPLSLGASFYDEALPLFNRLLRAGITVTHAFQTNGTLINEDFCSLFVKHAASVSVSLDGPEHIHNGRRKYRDGRGTFTQVMRGIESLNHYNIPFSVISVLSDITLEFRDDWFLFVEQNNIKNIGLLVEEIDGINKNSFLLKADFNGAALEWWTECFYFCARTGTRIREIDRMIDKILLPFLPNKVSVYATPGWFLNMAFNGDFSTFSPELLEQENLDGTNFIFGNVYKDNIFDALNSAKLKSIKNEIDEGTHNCATHCDYFSLCGGGYVSNKLFENGSFSSMETRVCRFMTKTLADAIFAIAENDKPSIQEYIKTRGASYNGHILKDQKK